MEFKYYFEVKQEIEQESKPIEEFYTPDTTANYQNFKTALDKNWGGEFPKDGIFTSELAARLGFSVPELLKNKIIQRSAHGNYELNKDLAATGGKISRFGSPPPPKPIKPMSWMDYVKRMKQQK